MIQHVYFALQPITQQADLIAVFLTTRVQIARKEAEVAKVVDQARRNSDRRLLAAGGRLDAQNELEQALLERTVRDSIRLSLTRAQTASALLIISAPNMAPHDVGIVPCTLVLQYLVPGTWYYFLLSMLSACEQKIQ